MLRRAWLAAALAAAASAPASAQPFERPAQERLPLPPFEEPAGRRPEIELPALPELPGQAPATPGGPRLIA